MIKNKILILISASSSGKNYVFDCLIYNYNFKPLISHTTRPMRPNETNGRDYHFVSDSQFKELIDNDLLVEYRTYNTLVSNIPAIWYYGLSKQTIDDLNPNTNYVTIFDVQGAKDFIEYYGRDNCYVCMIKCDDKIREERAKLRGGFSQEEWDRRLADDLVVFSDDNTKNLIDHYIINDGTIDELNDKLKILLDRLMDK